MTDELVAPLLLERYRPLELIARGGSSFVYRGRDEHLGRAVAIKLFSAGGAEETERFHDEVRVLAGLSHHGIVSIVDAGIDPSTPDDPRPFLIMEFLRGETLRAILAEGALAPRRVGEIGFELAEALEYVHEHGVIHRDISPSNVILTDYGTTFSRPRARLTDFGLAVDVSNPVPGGGSAVGTAAYVSPEQALGLPLTTASDIYSLGLVMLEGFTGVLAFPGDIPTSAAARLETDPPIPDRVDKPWRKLISAMTHRDPTKRPDAAEVAVLARRQLRAAGHHKKS
jgi:serine/threonine protein kinase